jgi:hypothetical protein
MAQMPPRTWVLARFSDVETVRSEERVGVMLGFRPRRARLGVSRVDDFADLGPALTIPAVAGLGKVLRLLRATRIAAPSAPLHLVGREREAAALLERAVGQDIRIEVRPRMRMRFQVWTEQGVETIEDVLDVREVPDAWLVLRRHERIPRRFDRREVVRQNTETERWHEVLDIERA